MCGVLSPSSGIYSPTFATLFIFQHITAGCVKFKALNIINGFNLLAALGKVSDGIAIDDTIAGDFVHG